MEITELLEHALKNNASDLHLSAGLPPILRVDGDLHQINGPTLDHKAVAQMLHEIMTHQQCQEYRHGLEIDFAFEIRALGRFRVNAYHQSRGASAVFRIIPDKVQSMEDLKLPAIFKEIVHYPKGLVLVTGPTGSGKSTTLAAMIDFINTTHCKHILTIEDPIEFIYKSNKCLINQREVGKDTSSFAKALRAALREDPDIILVGELRDLETMRLAMTAAETGHLVFATMHTNSATHSINRIIDVFPGEEKTMVRTVLSESLQAVIAQNLLKKTGGGRVAAFEVMICTPAIRNLIREGKIAQIYSCMQTGAAHGMITSRDSF